MVSNINLNDIYKKIVDQSIKRFFFDKIKLPNNFECKLEIIQLNIIIMLWYCEKNKINKNFSLNLINFFLNDVEVAMRELGISETSLGKKKRIIAENFYGRLYSYSDIFELDDIPKLPLTEKLKINFKSNEINYENLFVYVSKNLKYFKNLDTKKFKKLEFNFIDLI